MSDVFSRVLLAGGAGFIGSHVLDRLLERYPASHITIVDNFITGSRENIQHRLEDPRVELVEHDLTDFAWLPVFLTERTETPFTLILHLASPASPPRYQAQPVLTYLVNSMTTHYLAEYATRTQARMLFASTSEIYGDPLEHPQTESYWGNVNPNGIRSCYDESKRLGETICGVHTRDFGADIRLIRIFNTYGPRMDPTDGRVIPNFLRSVLSQEPLTLYGNGEQTRSFCYVDDLVEGILRMSERDGLAGETVNLGNPREFTLRELISKIEEMSGKNLEVVFQELPADDPQRRRPNISKAQRLLEWTPQIELEEGLLRTFQDFSARLGYGQ